MDIQKYSRDQIQSYSYPITEHFDYSSITSALEVLLSIDSLSKALLASEPHSIKLSFKVKKLAQSFKSSSDPFASFFSYLPPALKQDLTPWQVISTFVEDFNTEIQDYVIGLHFVSVSKLLSHTGRPQEVFEKELGQKKVKVAVFELVWDVDVTMENVSKVVKCIPGNLQSQGFMEVTGIISCGGCYYTSVCKAQDNWKFYDKFADKDPVSWVKIAWFLVSGNRYPSLLAYHRAEGYKSTANFITSLDFENLLKFSKKQDALVKQRSRNTEKIPEPKLQEKPPLKPSSTRTDIDDQDQSRKSQPPITRKYDFSEFKPESKLQLSRDYKSRDDIKGSYKKTDQVSPRNREDSVRSWDKSEEMERIYLGTPKESMPTRSYSRQEESFPKLNYTPQRFESREANRFVNFSPKDGEKLIDYTSPYFREKNLKEFNRDERLAGKFEFDERGEGINREDLQSFEYKSASRVSESAKKDQKFRPSFENFSKEDLGPRKDPDESLQKQPKHFESLLEKYRSESSKGFQDKFDPDEQKPGQAFNRDFKFDDRWKLEMGKRAFEGKEDGEGHRWKAADAEKFERKEENLNEYKGLRSRDEKDGRVEDKYADFERFKNRKDEDFRVKEERMPELSQFKFKDNERESESAGLRFRHEELDDGKLRFRNDDKRDYGEKKIDLDRFRNKVEENYEEKEAIGRFREKNEGMQEFDRFKGNNEEKFNELDRFRGKNEEKLVDIDRFRGKNEEKFADIERFRGKTEEKFGDIPRYRVKSSDQSEELDNFKRKTEDMFDMDRYKKNLDDKYSEQDRFRPKPEEKYSDFRFKSEEPDSLHFRTPETFTPVPRQDDFQDRLKSRQEERYQDPDRFKPKPDSKLDFRSELRAQDLSLKDDPVEKPSIRQFRSFDNSELQNRFKLEHPDDQSKLEEIRSRLYRPDSPKEQAKDLDSNNSSQLFRKPDENFSKFRQPEENFNKFRQPEGDSMKFRQAEANRNEDSGLVDWNCSKCSKSVPGTSYECTECRLINWDQFYKVKSLQHSRNKPEDSGNRESLVGKDEAVKRLYSFSDKKEEDAQDWTCNGCGTANKSLFFLCKGCRKPKTQSEVSKKEYRFSS